MGKIFIFCRIQLKFRFWLYKKRWHTSWKFLFEKPSDKKVIAKKPLTNLYEMNSSYRICTYMQTTAFLFSPARQNIFDRAKARASVLSSQDGSLLKYNNKNWHFEIFTFPLSFTIEIACIHNPITQVNSWPLIGRRSLFWRQLIGVTSSFLMTFQ